jgi:type 1 glutamine amidotransferase
MRILFSACCVLFAFAAGAGAADKRIVLLAGPPSHPPLTHEHNAGVRLFARCLGGTPGLKMEVHLNGGPTDWAEFEGAAAVVIYSDGGARHPALQGERLATLDRIIRQGTGLVTLHYAVEPTPVRGQREFLAWQGGAFEPDWSVNPHWRADFVSLPEHPIPRGVRPFQIHDEWYFHLRFPADLRGVTSILTAVPPPETMQRPDGHHSGNPTVRKVVAARLPQTVAWAYERHDGGRGFGFTGGHNHLNWGHDDQRKLVLNAILWVAKDEVPAEGVSSTVTREELMANLDSKPVVPGRPSGGK